MRKRDPLVLDTALGMLVAATVLWIVSRVDRGWYLAAAGVAFDIGQFIAFWLAAILAVLGIISIIVAVVGTKTKPTATPVAANDDKSEWP